MDLNLRITADGAQAKTELAAVERHVQGVEKASAKTGASTSKVMQALATETSKVTAATEKAEVKTQAYGTTAAKVATSLGVLNTEQAAAVTGASAMAGATGLLTVALTAAAAGAIVLATGIGAVGAALFAASQYYVEQSGILEFHQGAIDRVSDAWDRLKFRVGEALVGSGADVTTWLDFVSGGLELLGIVIAKRIDDLMTLIRVASNGGIVGDMFTTSLPTMQNATTDVNGQLTAFGRLRAFQQMSGKTTTASLLPTDDIWAKSRQAEADAQRHWMETQHERERESKRLAKEFDQMALEMVKRVNEESAARDKLQLWMGRNATSLQDEIRARRIELSIYPPLIANYGYLTDAMQDQRTGLERLNDGLRDSAALADGEFKQSQEQIHDVITQAAEALEREAVAMQKGLDFGRRLSQSIMGAIQGGGNVGRSVGAFLGDEIGAAMGEKLAKKLAKSIGDSAAGVIGGLLGPLGAIGGSLLGGLVDKMFGQKGRDSVVEFAGTMGGFDALQRKLETLGATGARLWVNLTQGVGRNNPEQARAAIEAINRALQGQSDQHARAAAAIEKYGFTFDELGSKIQNSRITDLGNELLLDFQALSAEGVNTDAIINRMGDSVTEFVQKAIATGTEVPIAMKPMLEQMLKAGKLIGENGEALEDLEDITWAKSLTQGFDQVTKAIYELRDALVDGVGGAIDDLNRREVHIRTRVDTTERDDVPSFANGSNGYRDFGSGTLAMLHGRERVMTEAEGRTGAQIVVNTYLDGELISRNTEQHITRRLQGRMKVGAA